MRLLPYILILSLLSACDQNGNVSLDGQTILAKMDGPKVPTVKDSQVDVAKMAEKNGNFKQATQIYQQLTEKYPDDQEMLLLLADSLRKDGEYTRAISAYDYLIDKNANNAGAKEGKALALLSKGDFESPTPIFQEVLKIDPKRWKTLNALGILFVTRGLYSESQQYFEEALKNNPNSASVLNNLGLSKALNKQYDNAIDALQRASAQTTNGSYDRKRIELNLALVYATSGNLEEARKIAETHLSGAELNNNLGLYAHLAKDDELAKSYLNMALTESKTFYGKAWDNLDALSGTNSSNAKSKSITTTKMPEEKKEPSKATKSKNEKVIPSPSTTQSLGTIKVPAGSN